MLRVLSLATNMLIMLFIQSLTYNITNEDPRQCEVLTTEETCLQAKSAFQTGQSQCYWNPDERTPCTLVEPDSSIKVILFVSIFSAVISTPLALFVDWLLMRVLAPPTRPPTTSALASHVTTLAAVAPDEATRPEQKVIPRQRNGSVVLLTPIFPASSPSSTAPADSTTALTAAPGPSADRARRGRVSITSLGRLGSLFGSLRDPAAASAESVAHVQAHSDLRQLVTKLTKYREQLTPDERTEFDGTYESISITCNDDMHALTPYHLIF
jgi:hypothetical protein